MRAIIVALCALLTACAPAVTVRQPICEPPAIPATLMEPCEEPELLTDGEFRTVYLQAIRDTGPWGRCMRNHDKLIEIVKYRDSVCQKVKQDNMTTDKPGWKWPWEK